MGRIGQPELVTPIASVFTGDETLFMPVHLALAERLGPVVYVSELLPFDTTNYYAPEMGEGLKRRIFAFRNLLDPAELPALKRWTNELEEQYAVQGRRRVNIDSGYVSLAKLVLATTKDNIHRIYLGQGIYAEVTLRYRAGHFEPWPWTYPDYASPPYLKIAEEIRELHRKLLRAVPGVKDKR
ncbi:MAG: DUF4416 family protein [Firmicutes bacterium]|jgi:hypothetical protein|nr:DUF4416 family protein [Bacillota bacterium]